MSVTHSAAICEQAWKHHQPHLTWSAHLLLGGKPQLSVSEPSARHALPEGSLPSSPKNYLSLGKVLNLSEPWLLFKEIGTKTLTSGGSENEMGKQIEKHSARAGKVLPLMR